MLVEIGGLILCHYSHSKSKRWSEHISDQSILLGRMKCTSPFPLPSASGNQQMKEL